MDLTRSFAAFKKKIVTKSSSEHHSILVFDEIQVRKEMKVHAETMTYAGFADFGEVASPSGELADHKLVFILLCIWFYYSQPVTVFASKGPTRGGSRTASNERHPVA